MTRAFETHCKILIVDDEESNVLLVTRILESAGYEQITGVTDSRKLIETMDEWEPDLVVLDLHMPHIDGFTLLDEIRERELPSEFVPVIVLTADVTHETLIRAMESGANDFLTKPFDVDEVLIRIRNLLVIRVSFKDLVVTNAELAKRLVERMKFVSYKPSKSGAAVEEVART